MNFFNFSFREISTVIILTIKMLPDGVRARNDIGTNTL